MYISFRTEVVDQSIRRIVWLHSRHDVLHALLRVTLAKFKGNTRILRLNVNERRYVTNDQIEDESDRKEHSEQEESKRTALQRTKRAGHAAARLTAAARLLRALLLRRTLGIFNDFFHGTFLLLHYLLLRHLLLLALVLLLTVLSHPSKD